MVDYLSAVQEHGTRARDVLTERGYHPNVVYAKAEKAARKGYTEYGVAVDLAWLTEKGEAYLLDPPADYFCPECGAGKGPDHHKAGCALVA